MTIKEQSLADRPWDDPLAEELLGAPANVATEVADPGSLPARDEDAEAFARDAAEALAAADLAPTPEEQALDQANGVPVGDSVEGETPADIGVIDEEAREAEEKLAARSKKLSAEQVRHVLHALLFVADRPLTVEQLKAATGLDARRIQKALDRLSGELREGVSGVVLSEIAGGWQLRTAPEAGDYVRRFLHVRPRRLTRAALETLAIVAYRQPVTRPEIEDIRGVDCGAVLKALLEWKLLKILGKKDEVGRPLLYGTTREFLEFFQLKDLASLPTLREFHELSEESRQIVEEELGPDPVAPIAGTVAELADPAFLEKEAQRSAESEAALRDLERAMADAEEKAGQLAGAIRPVPAAAEE
jgi:segregation and condensation protein B